MSASLSLSTSVYQVSSTHPTDSSGLKHSHFSPRAPRSMWLLEDVEPLVGKQHASGSCMRLDTLTCCMFSRSTSDHAERPLR